VLTASASIRSRRSRVPVDVPSTKGGRGWRSFTNAVRAVLPEALIVAEHLDMDERLFRRARCDTDWQDASCVRDAITGGSLSCVRMRFQKYSAGPGTIEKFWRRNAMLNSHDTMCKGEGRPGSRSGCCGITDVMRGDAESAAILARLFLEPRSARKRSTQESHILQLGVAAQALLALGYPSMYMQTQGAECGSPSTPEHPDIPSLVESGHYPCPTITSSSFAAIVANGAVWVASCIVWWVSPNSCQCYSKLHTQ